MRLSEEQIKDINSGSPSEQGVFTEPWGIPVSIKEPVVYMRYSPGGWSGGGYRGEEPSRYTNSEVPEFDVLDMVLKVLKPDISYLDYKMIVKKLVQTNEDTEREYYGNSTDWIVKYIILSELEKALLAID
jgi:hypothetical protein